VAYRAVIDAYTMGRGWAVAAAVTTLFLEGTPQERAVLAGTARPDPPLERHPLVVHYGLPVASLALTRAHRSVEGDHRLSAWRSLLDHAPEGDRSAVIEAMEQTLAAWKDYRAAIAAAVLLGG
jgi:pyrroloquinoline-quinone synthase